MQDILFRDKELSKTCFTTIQLIDSGHMCNIQLGKFFRTAVELI